MLRNLLGLSNNVIRMIVTNIVFKDRTAPSLCNGVQGHSLRESGYPSMVVARPALDVISQHLYTVDT